MVPEAGRRKVAGGLALLGGLALAGLLPRTRAARAGVRETARAVVGLRAEIHPEARSLATLGRERIGSGVAIDAAGLVLTIGYLVLEASGIELRAEGRAVPGEVVAYDGESGLALVRAKGALGVQPAPLGRAAELPLGTPLLVVSRATRLDGRQVSLVDRREFAGYWEYLCEEALFTRPPHPEFAGAALVEAGGTVVGIGSLFVSDAAARGVESPGNMFVPVDLLRPILADLLAFGRRQTPPRPWLGLFLREEGAMVRVVRVAEGGPAERAGVRAGDLVIALAGERVGSLAELYRRLWNQGPAGIDVTLDLHGERGLRRVIVTSMDRDRWLRWGRTF
ncbi:MAG: S1C family serine protease [Geminicoccaceae bacterium]|nr:S1C family serine protease [Geminicoccaceae bacterium]MCS7266764.1 S1C family serine protease [Geminicoccaceae bacterium]MDW8123785.1 S1C family serine protease [Geminicoccaceae bacterium]MDW8341617.1 S1C family serine protease [Geminicoccaceae bacterium]